MARWGGRFEDSAGSRAHAAMLAAQGIISEQDAEAIRAGLAGIEADIDAGAFTFDIDVEDIHVAFDADDTSPLGEAGLAGNTYPLDRAMTAAELGFSRIIENSLDAVYDRDFAELIRGKIGRVFGNHVQLLVTCT